MKTLRLNLDSCVRCGGSSGPEVIPGDVVKLWLDQSANTNFPEWVEANVQIIHQRSSDTVFGYTVQYDEEHLEGAAVFLRDCDVLSTTCEGCCVIINDYLAKLAAINKPEVSLSYTWDGTDLILKAQAYSRQIGQTGEQVTISTYSFKDPSNVTIAATGDVDERTYEPADTVSADWPGGVFSVTVTDSRGLTNTSEIFVAPRPRLRWEVATAVTGASTASVMLTAGEEIYSAMLERSDEGVMVLGLDPLDESVIQLSAVVVANLNVRVLIHTP